MRVGQEKQKQTSLVVHLKHLSYLKTCPAPCLSMFVTAFCYALHCIGHPGADTGVVPGVREGQQGTPEAVLERLRSRTRSTE